VFTAPNINYFYPTRQAQITVFPWETKIFTGKIALFRSV